MARKDSEQALLTAVEQLLLAAKPIGVNTVAAESGVNKALIYRYFGNFDGLLTRFAEQVNLWRAIRMQLEEKLNDNSFNSSAEVAQWLFHQYRVQLQASPIYCQIMRLEMTERNPLTIQLEADREQEGLKVSQLIAENFADDSVDTLAIGAIMTAGLTYLVLRSKDIRWFNGIDLNEDKQWQRLENSFLGLLNSKGNSD